MGLMFVWFFVCIWNMVGVFVFNVNIGGWWSFVFYFVL